MDKAIHKDVNWVVFLAYTLSSLSEQAETNRVTNVDNKIEFKAFMRFSNIWQVLMSMKRKQFNDDY